MRSPTALSPLVTFIVATAVGGCSFEEVQPDRSRLALSVSPLSLPGVYDACYTLTVKNEAQATVWTEAGLCSTKFGTQGGLTYVGSCDATDVDGGGAVNTVILTIDGLYSAPGVALTDYQDPCKSPHNPGGCKLAATCVENADTAVTFNLTILREANQGFFDIAVSFDDIFCSAKVDCQRSAGVPLELLHNPTTGQRAQTAVVSLACTAGPDETGTVLLRDPLRVTCGGTTTVLNPTQTRGNAFGTGAGQIADPAPADAVWQYAIYAGEEDLSCGGAPCKKQYWNVAIGFDPTATNCVLTTRASAMAGTDGSVRSTPTATTWPIIDVQVPLTTNTTPGTRACTTHPLNETPAGVSTTYTSPTSPVAFSYSFDGNAFASTAPVVTSGLRLLIDPASSASVTTASSVAYDLSGNGFNGTFRSASGVATNLSALAPNLRYDTTDVPPACLNFAGYGDANQNYLQWTAHPLAGYSSYTLESWFKVPSLSPASEYNVVFYSSAPDSNWQEFGMIVQASTSDPDVGVEVDNDWTAGDSGVRVDLNWNHLVFAYDGNFGRLYVNGVLRYTRNSPDNNTLQSTGWNWIGVGQWANSNYNGAHGYTQGKLGYLAMYGKSLTQTEIQQNYDALKARFGR